eukprot:gene21328-biopygen16361
MLKLARNALADLGLFYGADDKKIEWKFFKFLHDTQEDQRFKLANTFSSGHLDYKKNKMKVSLAVRALSSSVADAIEFLRDGLGVDRFKSRESTVQFIRQMDRLFDILNPRNRAAKGFKQPLRLATLERWTSVLRSTADYPSPSRHLIASC